MRFPWIKSHETACIEKDAEVIRANIREVVNLYAAELVAQNKRFIKNWEIAEEELKELHIEHDKLKAELEIRRTVMADIVRELGYSCGGLSNEEIAPKIKELRVLLEKWLAATGSASSRPYSVDDWPLYQNCYEMRKLTEKILVKLETSK